MNTFEQLQRALQILVDIDQESLSVSVGSDDRTQEECYEQARKWLELAVSHAEPF